MKNKRIENLLDRKMNEIIKLDINMYDIMFFTIDKHTSDLINFYMDNNYNKHSKILYDVNVTLKENSKVVQMKDNSRLNVKKGYVGKVIGVDIVDNTKYLTFERNSSSSRSFSS